MRCKMPFCTVPEDFEHFLDVTAIDTTQVCLALHAVCLSVCH